MSQRSPLVYDVVALLENPRTRREVAIEAPVASLGTELARVEAPLHFDLVLEAIDGGILVQGTISGTYEGACRRCLGPVERAFSLAGSEMYRPRGEVWEEGYVIADGKIDLERVARDTVGLDLPVNPLCRDDCAGLCPTCGANLNDGPCSCPPVEGDLRWAPLRELGRKLSG